MPQPSLDRKGLDSAGVRVRIATNTIVATPLTPQFNPARLAVGSVARC